MTVKRTKRGRPQAPVNQSLKYLDSLAVESTEDSLDWKINLGATLLQLKRRDEALPLSG
jgi:hypothetical protein